MDKEPSDAQVISVFIKIRTAISNINKEYEARLNHLKEQQQRVSAELLRRLHERGATQTKTETGTAFIGESMSVTIADEDVYGAFVLGEQDMSYYQKRAKAERVKEYMKAHDGALPPGLNVFRELVINVRAPRAKGTASEPSNDDSRADEHSAE